MVQMLSAFGMKGRGIVATLLVGGIILTQSNIDPVSGSIAIKGGVSIGIMLGMLGVFGVLKRI